MNIILFVDQTTKHMAALWNGNFQTKQWHSLSFADIIMSVFHSVLSTSFLSVCFIPYFLTVQYIVGIENTRVRTQLYQNQLKKKDQLARNTLAHWCSKQWSSQLIHIKLGFLFVQLSEAILLKRLRIQFFTNDGSNPKNLPFNKWNTLLWITWWKNQWDAWKLINIFMKKRTHTKYDFIQRINCTNVGDTLQFTVDL